ncbi:C39 family peptidase [Saccharopolyspora sp. ID03-671]|uniref:C39 family peptidase n=1 Tax=Saccharopolyspora sp. ID03-671 TaxID=3073066 RepID=UPI0032458575
MYKHRKTDGQAPNAAVRALTQKLSSHSGGDARSSKVSGKALSAAIVGTAVVAIGYPVVAGADPEPAPVSSQVLPAAQAAPAPALPPGPAAAPAAVVPSAPEVRPQAVTKSLAVDYQAQETGYWCGPAAARIALSAMTKDLPSQAALATELGTTENGTDHISQFIDVLNKRLAGNRAPYVVKEWAGRPITPEMKNELWSDVIRNVDAGKATVANIVATPDNQPPGYPADQTIYHYVSVIGYNAENQTVHISDSARFSGITEHWLSLDQLASLIQTKGYAV